MSADACCDSRDIGRSAYKTLLLRGESAFHATLGGGRESDHDKYARIGLHGFYWTSTSSDTATAWFYNFGIGQGKLFIQNDGEKAGHFLCVVLVVIKARNSNK